MHEAKAKRQAALISVAASFVLTLLKLTAGLASGSLALLSEGAHNALDIAASAITYFAVRIADTPADEDHPFGHAKVEALAALAETGFLVALSVGVAAVALTRLGEPAPLHALGFAFFVLAISIGVDLFRLRTLRRVARETGSDAIAAEVLHYTGDLVGSVLVLIGLAAARAGFAGADSLAALAVAMFIAISGLRLGKRTIDALLDAAPAGLAEQARQAVEEVAGVVGVDYLRLRRVGAGAVGELGLILSRVESLEGAEAIEGRVRKTLADRWPRLSLTIAARPLALDEETVLERVLLVAARRRLFVHHVTIQRVGERLAVSLDLEVDRRMTLGLAHDIASQLEAALEAEFDGAIEVDTHIEPMEPRELPGEEADPKLTSALAESLIRHAKSGRLSDIHHVRLRRAGTGYYGVFHCHADRGASIELIHRQVDALERAARAEFPAISRIIGHAEPLD